MAVPVNVPVLLFSAGLAMASALMFGLSPALSFSRPRLTATARTTAGVEGRRAHHVLLAAQIALTVLLLAGTGAAVRVLIGLYRTSLGYDPHNVIIASINLPDRTSPGQNSYTEWADRATFYARLRNRMADVPQVESVALATFSGIPPQSGQRSVVEVPGRDITGYETPIVQRISAHYFATTRIPLIRGRVWSDSESGGTPHVAVVNQTMARELWPDESVIGRRVRMPEYVKSPTYFRLPAPGSDGWFEIVGVVGDTPNVGLHARFAYQWNWDGNETELQSRCTDEIGQVQPSRAQIAKYWNKPFDETFSVPGLDNSIQPWRIAKDGSVTNGNA